MACSQLWMNPHPSPKPTPPTPYCLEKSVHWEEGRKLAFLPLPVLSLHFSLSQTQLVLLEKGPLVCVVGPLWAESGPTGQCHQATLTNTLPDGHVHFVT